MTTGGSPYTSNTLPLYFQGKCDLDMPPSKDTIRCRELKDLGDHYFDGPFYLYVIKNVSHPGEPPELEFRLILDYVPADGALVTYPFSAPVEPGDEIFIRHDLPGIDTAFPFMPPDFTWEECFLPQNEGEELAAWFQRIMDTLGVVNHYSKDGCPFAGVVLDLAEEIRRLKGDG